MTSNFGYFKCKLFLLIFVFSTVMVFSQTDREKWKLQLAFGLNNPIDGDNDDAYYTEYINFPTINLGVQHMFNNSLGAKLDFGYNRSSNGEGSDAFKLNYSRINAQLVYDSYELLQFLPASINIVAHVGPGISITKPLSPYSENKYSFLNMLGGLELHYGISETFSIYGDISYVFGLSNASKYDPAIDGFSFNGDLLYATIGVSVSLSGCYYCD